MGTQLVWNERYNIGVEIIDREHKKLFIYKVIVYCL